MLVYQVSSNFGDFVQAFGNIKSNMFYYFVILHSIQNKKKKQLRISLELVKLSFEL